MSLSEQELRVLREIEQSLMADDPHFGSTASVDPTSGGRVTLRGGALLMLGLLFLVGGVALAQQSLWFIALSVVGFLIMFGAGVWMLRGGVAPRVAPTKSGGGVGSRLEENFRRRFEER